MTPPPNKPSAHREHFAEVFRWSSEARFDMRRVLASLIAMAAPVLLGLWLGKPTLGYVIGLGAMLMAGEAESPDERPSLLTMLGPPVLAVAVATLLGRLPLGDVAMIALIVPVATLVNYSRPAAGMAIRFIILLVLNLNLVAAHSGHGGDHSGGGAALMFGLGAIWRVLVRLTVRRRKAEPDEAPEASPPARTPTPRQRRIHFGRMLRTLQGWQYPLRLGAGLAVACLIRDLWPQHHYQWVVLSIVLVTPRALEHVPVHITQRAVGTIAGVALAGAMLHVAPGHAVIAALICLLGAAAPLVRAGNYAAYCVLSTPVILLAMDAGMAAEDRLLVDRLIATLAASAIVIAANLLMDATLRLSAPTPATR